MNGRIFTDCTTSTDTLNVLVYLCRVTITIWKRLRIGSHDKDRKEYYMYGIGRKGTNHERRESTENERVQERYCRARTQWLYEPFMLTSV